MQRRQKKKGTYIRFYTATGGKVEINAKEEENEPQQADAGGKGVKAPARLREYIEFGSHKGIRDHEAGEQDLRA